MFTQNELSILTEFSNSMNGTIFNVFLALQHVFGCQLPSEYTGRPTVFAAITYLEA